MTGTSRLKDWGFFLFSLAAALAMPAVYVMYLLSDTQVDGDAIFHILMGAVILGVIGFAAAEFETDGVTAWLMGVSRMPRLSLSLNYSAGLALKALGVFNGAAALIQGCVLTWMPQGLPHSFFFWIHEYGLTVRIVVVVWLWFAAALAYLTGDARMRRATRTEAPEAY